MTTQKEQRLFDSMPSIFKAGNNSLITGLLKAVAQEDEAVAIQYQEAKNQLFVNYASAKYLNALGNNVGVTRPSSYPTSDDNYRAIIPILSYRPKQLKKTIYELFDAYWGQEYTRSTVTARHPGTYSLTDGDELKIRIDDGEEHTIIFNTADFDNIMFCTIEEIIAKIDYYQLPIIASKYKSYSGKEYLRIKTKTMGGGGSIQITAQPNVSGFPVMDFFEGKIQNVRCSVYEINPNELVIKIPNSIPIECGLKNANHFHTDTTIYGTTPPTINDPYWPGAFIYDTPTPTELYTVHSTRTTITQTIESGQVYNKMDVTNSADFPAEGGHLVFDFGNDNVESMVPYSKRLNSTSLYIDASYTFVKNHTAGSTVNLVTPSHYVTKQDGSDYGFFINNPRVAEELMTELLKLIKAAGVIVRFEIGNLNVSVNEFGPFFDIGFFSYARMTTAQRNAMVATWGLAEESRAWFNSTTKQWEFWNGTSVAIKG